jgi:hypothetical protein
MSIVEDVLSITDDILGLRDELGAIKHKVYIVTRTWPEVKGVGAYVEEVAQILPTPFLQDYSQDLRVREGGNIRQGDIVLKHISKQSYPSEDKIDCSVPDSKKMEKYYKINNRLYEVVNVKEDYVYWNVQVRKTIKKA